MFLNEEYFLRHGVDTPLIKAQDRSSLILKASSRRKWKTPWVIFDVVKIQEYNYRPPYFNFSFLQPLHDGCEQGSFTKSISNKKVYFDEYEVEMVCHVSNFEGLEPISDLAEAKMASWDIFLYCNDYRLVQIPARLKSYLWQSVDQELSIEDRMQAQEKVLKGLQRSNLLPRWEMVSQYCNPLWYASWYAKVINDVREKVDQIAEYSNIRNIA